MYKTLTVFFAVFIASALLLPAQNLVITAPNGGETLTLGQTFPIAWTVQNSTQKIKLILFQNGSRLGEIAENLKLRPIALQLAGRRILRRHGAGRQRLHHPRTQHGQCFGRLFQRPIHHRRRCAAPAVAPSPASAPTSHRT